MKPKTAHPSEFVVALWLEAPVRVTGTPLGTAKPLRSVSWTVALPVVVLSAPTAGVSSPVSVTVFAPVAAEVTVLESFRDSALAPVFEQLTTPALSLTQSVRETTV